MGKQVLSRLKNLPTEFLRFDRPNDVVVIVICIGL